MTFEHPAHMGLGNSPHIGVTNLLTVLNAESANNPDQVCVLLGGSQGAQFITDALLPADQRIAGQQAGAPEHRRRRPHYCDRDLRQPGSHR